MREDGRCWRDRPIEGGLGREGESERRINWWRQGGGEGEKGGRGRNAE